MTKIGSIKLKLRVQDPHFAVYESEKGAYRLHVPRHPDFTKLPPSIEITVSTEEQVEGETKLLEG